MISIIIPLYNKEHIITKSIQSVLDQSYQDFELIIVNDGSTDNSVKEAEKFNDNRIRLIHQKNKGVSAARNRGIEEAKHDLVSFLDGDDWWDKNFLKTFIDLSNKFPEAGLYAGQYVQINSENEIIKLDRFPPIDEGIFNLHEYFFAVWSSSIMIRKHVFHISGTFDENLTHGEDTDLWIRIALSYKLCYTNKVVAYYNIGSNPLTRSVGKVPAFNNHFLSKIDDYIGRGDVNLDSVLMERKVINLRKLYIQYPFNKSIQKMIKGLPEEELMKNENNIFKTPFLIICLKHFILIIYQRLFKIKNLYFLKFK